MSDGPTAEAAWHKAVARVHASYRSSLPQPGAWPGGLTS